MLDLFHSAAVQYVIIAVVGFVGTIIAKALAEAAIAYARRHGVQLSAEKQALVAELFGQAVMAVEQRAGVAKPEAITSPMSGEQKKAMAIEIAEQLMIAHGVPPFAREIADHLVEAAVGFLNARKATPSA